VGSGIDDIAALFFVRSGKDTLAESGLPVLKATKYTDVRRETVSFVALS
jgi:hypothetical protein